DQDVSGNKGYIQGSIAEVDEGAKPIEREYIDIKFELPNLGEIKDNLPKAKVKKKERTADQIGDGNQGYLSKGAGFEEELPPVRKEEPRPAAVKKVIPPPAAAHEEIEQDYEENMKEESYVPEPALESQTYKVKSGDSLSKISKDVYGKASKWTVIYEANADKIKDPNRIKEGTVLVIPALEESESGYSK
ncbi:MAG: LysM peptidoglycan-binding domain-containing protein, partial [Candidatus Omnitrophota bacterium]